MDGRGASSVVVYSLLIFRAVLYAGDHCQELTASRKQEIAAYVNKRYKGPVAAPLVLATVEAQEQCYLKLRFTPSEQRGRDLVLYLAPDRRFLTSELFDSTVDPVKADRAAQERLKKVRSFLTSNVRFAEGKQLLSGKTFFELTELMCGLCFDTYPCLDTTGPERRLRRPPASLLRIITHLGEFMISSLSTRTRCP